LALELRSLAFQNMSRNAYDALTIVEMKAALGPAAFKSCKNKAMMLAIIPNLTDEQRATLQDVLRSKNIPVSDAIPGPSNARDVNSTRTRFTSH
jgi:hypothetical protein